MDDRSEERLDTLTKNLRAARERADRDAARLDDLEQQLAHSRSKLSNEATRVEGEAVLENAEAALRGIIVPPDPRHPMYPSPIGFWWELGLVLFSVGTPITLGALAYHYWPVFPEAWSERSVFGMVLLLGMLGGSVHLVTSAATHIGKRDLTRNWIPYYILLPIQGGALAPVVYLLQRAAIAAPNDVGRLNLTAVFGIAGLTGLFSRQAIEALANTAEQFFAKIEAHPGTTPRMTEPAASPASTKA